MRGTQHQIENTAATEESLEDRHPFGGVLPSSCPRGAWNQQNFSKGKGCRRHHSSITTGETFQGLHYSHTLHSPGEFVCFQCEKKKWMLTYVNCTPILLTWKGWETSSYSTEKTYWGSALSPGNNEIWEVYLHLRQKVASQRQSQVGC